VYRAGDARFRRLLMNKLQLTKGELTKIILEEVRNLQEQVSTESVAKADNWWDSLTPEQKVATAGEALLGTTE
jgi:hypothetical protein